MMALQKELREIERDKNSGVTVRLKGSSLQRLIGTVEGATSRDVVSTALPWKAV